MKRLVFYLAIVFLCVFSAPVVAVPTFQAYIDGGVAADMGDDEDSWFSTDSTLSLIVVGSTDDSELTDVTLVLSVFEGETGTISITGGDVGATLLTTAVGVNPDTNANEDLLTDVVGIDGYDTKDFLPVVIPDPDNNHYPFKNDISDFLIFDLGIFTYEGEIHDYDADTGIISGPTGSGEEKTYLISITGFTMVHFDVYGFDGDVWKINPGSHDSTYNQIPAPGAILLGSIGVSFVGWLRRRKTL